MLIIYCDGACSKNPGPGSWAYIAVQDKVQIACGYGVYSNTTNNKMELMAVINALYVFQDCTIVLDSLYVRDGITKWIHGWKKNGWKTSAGPVKNLELWQELDALTKGKNIIWEWQRSHVNNEHDIVDALARHALYE